ncbi:hypothetical protein C8R47DRAFT_1073602 [Mycena vitilis]|nr:hypothetical protein C8R47DRAFT_1073602 [Mycena vitilis]
MLGFRTVTSRAHGFTLVIFAGDTIEIFDLAACRGWSEVVVYYLRRLDWPVVSLIVEVAGILNVEPSKRTVTVYVSHNDKFGSEMTARWLGRISGGVRHGADSDNWPTLLLEHSQFSEQLLPFHHLHQPKAWSISTLVHKTLIAKCIWVRFAQLEMAVLEQDPGGGLLRQQGFQQMSKMEHAKAHQAIYSTGHHRLHVAHVPGEPYAASAGFIAQTRLGWQRGCPRLIDYITLSFILYVSSIFLGTQLTFTFGEDAQQFPRHLGALFKNSRYQLLEWLNHVKTASKSVLRSSQLESCDVELFDDISRFACEPFNGVTDHVCHRWRRPNESSAAGVVPSHTVAKVSGSSVKRYPILLNSTSSPENRLARSISFEILRDVNPETIRMSSQVSARFFGHSPLEEVTGAQRRMDEWEIGAMSGGPKYWKDLWSVGEDRWSVEN